MTFDTFCTGDDNKPLVIRITNSTGNYFVNVTGINDANVHLFSTWVIPTDYPVQNNMRANVTAENTPSNNVYFNISGLATNQLSIQNTTELYDGDWYWSETNGISAKVYDFQGNPAVGAICSVNFYSHDNPTQPYWTQDSTRVSADGGVIFNVDMSYDIYDLGQYLYQVSCQTSSVTSLTNTTLYSASGVAYDDLWVNPFVENVTAFTSTNATRLYTQSSESGCVQFTNSYRDYDQYYDIQYALLCDVPNQDVNVLSGTGLELLTAGQTATFCLPVLVPEVAAAGTGLCRLRVGISPSGVTSRMFGDFTASSGLFNVTSVFFGLTSDWVRLNQTSWHVSVNYPYALPSEVFTDVPARVLDAVNNPDLLTSAYLVFQNGSSFGSELRIVDVVQGDYVDAQGRRFRLRWNTSLIPLVVGGNYSVILNVRSEANLWEQMLVLFGRIAAALERWAGGAGISEGNYTIKVGTLTDFNDSGLFMAYNFSSYAVNTRRNLHFVYEVAPLVGGVEGAFLDQNPNVAGYQAASKFQALLLNSSKSFTIAFKPNLPSAGSYRLFESVYEYAGSVPVPEQYVGTETLLRQETYDFNSTSSMSADFNGDELRIDAGLINILG